MKSPESLIPDGGKIDIPFPDIGTKDAKRDAEIINEQEIVRDAMRLEESKMRLALRRSTTNNLLIPGFSVKK